MDMQTGTPNYGTTNELTIVNRSIGELKPNGRNPRIHSLKQIRQIARSIQSFGFNVPILIDRNMNVVAGHGRLLACAELGWKEVPTIQLEHLTEKQAKAFVIADNRLAEISTWDDALLAEHLSELSEMDLDFSIEVTGFDTPEIDLRIGALPASPSEQKVDQIPEIPDGTAISRPDDLWLLGKHRVYCGNALVADSFAALMQGERASAVFVDPPYNVPIHGNVGGLGKVKHREFVMASGEMDQIQFTAFLSTALTQLASVSTDGALHFVCMDWRHIEEVITAGRNAGHDLKNVCVWAKTNAGMGSLYRSQHELVFVFKHGSEPHRNNVELGRHGRNRTNVWSYQSPAAFGRKGEEGHLLSLHPTVKPVALVSDAILDCTARNEIVLDSFLGSGSTLIAADRVGRRCYGMELDPAYVDTVVRRWEAYSGQAARLAESGKSFDEVSADRGGDRER